MNDIDFAQHFQVDADRDRFGVTLFGEKTTGGWPKMVVLGTTTQVKQCENCGRSNLKHAIVCAVVDDNGHPTRRYHYFGSDCAGKIAGRSEKDVEDSASRLGEFRPGIRVPRPVKPMDNQKTLFAAKGDGMPSMRDLLVNAWKDHHAVAEPPGTDLFGEPLKPFKPTKADKPPKAPEKQGVLFNTKGLPNQTTFLDEPGLPDSLKRPPKADLFAAIDWATIDYFASRKPAPNQMAFDFTERPKPPSANMAPPSPSFPTDALVEKKKI